MSDAARTDKSTASTVTLVIGVLAVLLVALVGFQRQRYPDGTLVTQERTVVAENVNENLAEVLNEAVPGTTTTAELVEKLGDPVARLEGDDLSVWVYRQRKLTTKERMLFGLIPIGSGSSGFETVVPVGVRDGLVVYLMNKPGEGLPVKQAVEDLWATYGK